MNVVDDVFNNSSNSPMCQFWVSLAIGLAFAPLSSGIFYLAIFLIIREFLFAFFSGFDSRYWDAQLRAGLVGVSIFGYIVGRELSGFCITKVGKLPSFLPHGRKKKEDETPDDNKSTDESQPVV